jgi:gliding motility-associated-like protein
MRIRLYSTILTTVLLFCSMFVYTQITAPGSSFSFPTDYSPSFIGSGGENDLVYVFCGNQDEHNIGHLSVEAPGCAVSWHVFDGFSFVPLGQSGPNAVGLSSGLYMATIDCGGTISCYRAWVWVNQTLININPIDPGCETFTLSAQVDVMDNVYTINDPPGINFPINEDTYIKVCFWANHTYVSDLGFYLKAPGNHTTEPGNPGVVELLPAPSAWNTTIPWSATGCAPEDEAFPCNGGNNLEEFCFSTNLFPEGPELIPGDPSFVPCICDMPTPLEGIFASAGPWDNIYGFMAGDDGWAVQVYDCEFVDVGALTYVQLTFVGESECGLTSIVYESGEMYSPINDNSCDAATASIYVVPPIEPPGSYQVTSQITGYQWTCTGSTFTGNELSHQVVQGTSDFPLVTSDFILTVTETMNVPGNPSCQTSSSETFETLPVDATITPLDPVCANDAPFVLTAVDGGGTWSTNAQAGSIQFNTFYPAIAGGGTWDITYSLGGPCPDNDQITITVYESIEVVNFADTTCNSTNDLFTIEFDVITSGGNAASFYVDYGSGNQFYSGNFSQQFPSPSDYSLTVTDQNGCNEIIIEGYKDCGCTTYAGTMTSTVPVHLCDGECTDMLSHNGNQVLDGDDTFQYIIHSGGYPATILATNNTSPTFCFNQISEGVFGQTYYVSAIAGDNLEGNVDQADPCYSQSQGTPIIWHENPVAHITGNNYSTCGVTTELTANEPEPGMIGTWSATEEFTPLGGASFNNHNINVVVPDFGAVTFTWTVENNLCESSDDITVTFVQAPVAYAGTDRYICGNQIELEAILSIDGSTGEWSGSANFNPQTSPTATATVNTYGAHTFVWREYVADCYTQDYVNITFIQEPNPTTIADFDTVCGVVYNLQVFNSDPSNTGQWSATVDGLPYAANYDNPNSPNTIVIIPNYTGLFQDVTFTWSETNQAGGIPCTGEASINVTFAKQPVASVGASDQDEVCGNCFTFNADTTGSGWATGRWVAKDIIAWFPNEDSHLPDATICIDSLGSFGDSAHVEAQFLWVMRNTGCTSIDTMTVIFYKKPVANAGLDDEICGRDYCVGAVFSLPETPNYTPFGTWAVASRPTPEAQADIEPQTGDSVCVSVTHHGIWEFRFRENNSVLSSCFSADTVRIEFVEVPVVDAGEDKDVCGTTTQLEATTSAFTGTWLPNGASFVDYSDPHTNTSVSVYGPLNYIWLESNTAETSSLSCSSQDTVVITYWRVPQAVILTDEADSTTCGLTFENLRAQQPGSGITGFWWNETDPDADYGDPNSHNTHVTVSDYGYHDFYWVATNGPTFQPDFCLDTAGPLRIHFIEIPTANAGGDTLFCGYTGQLGALPSLGTGVWSTPSSALVYFEDENDPNTEITSQVLNTGNATYPHFNLIWTEDNTNGCTDKDTIKVIFARVPHSGFDIVPPKCMGEPATLSAQEDSLQQYQWNFYTGVIDSTVNNEEYNANYQHFVYWANDDTAHRVTLIVTNFWECQSAITIDTVYEPPIPDFGTILVGDTCSLGRGAIIIEDTVGTNAFYWLNEDFGPNPGTPVTAVYNLPEGEYDIRARYRTPNQAWYNYYITVFGNAMCTDTITYNIEAIGHLIAEFEIPLDVFLDELVAPEAEVTFVNNSDYGGVRRRCIWHFGDGTTLTSCDDIVYHTYTEADCYYPFLIVMNRDLQECRDTAYLEACIQIDNASSIEVPNIFTPNGDGINDFFQVKAQTLREFNGYIVNRWGNVVFEWTNWQDEEAGWDGKMPGGTKASAGVYFYIIKATGMDDEPYDLYGVLHLIRD